MPHETTLITTIVGGLVLAFIFGSIANRLKLPPLVGYLFAGVLVGPFTPGFIADQSLANQLSEIGVILLMFGVGLHFSLKDLMSVRALAIPGALVQIALATLLGYGLGRLMGWTDGASLLFGLALSVASTVVLLKAMQDRRLIETERGRIAVGWLIVEDLAMVLALVLVPAFANLAGSMVEIHDPFVSFVERIANTHLDIYGVVAVTVVKLIAFGGFMLIVGRRVIPSILHATAHTGNRELFRLAVLAIALGVALGSSYLFGVSLALGAFFAGMILSESELSQRAAQETLPLRDAFAVLFFVSVGMLFDPSILLSNPLPVLATLFIIIVGKSIAAFLIVLAFRRPMATALTISASLAQIGEFSFILATMGRQLNILPEDAQALIVAGAILSILLNPIVFLAVDRLKPRLEANVLRRKVASGEHIEPTLSPDAVVADSGDILITPDDRQETIITAEPLRQDNADDMPQPTTFTEHTIIVGYGRVGSVIANGLLAAHARFVVIEDADARVAAARAKGIEVIVGNAASHDVLVLANITRANCLLVAIPNAFEAGQAIDQGRKLNPTIRIIALAHSDDEEEHLKRLGADTVIMGEREIGLGMLGWLQNTVSGSTAPLEPVEQTSVQLAPTENLLAAMSAEQPLTAAAVDIPVAEVPPEEAQMTVLPSSDIPEPDIVETAPEEPSLPFEAEEVAAAAEPVALDAAEPLAQSEPAQAEPAEPEPAQAEPVEPELTEPEPVEPVPELAANVEPPVPSQPPAPTETPAPAPIETPTPSAPPETPPVEPAHTDPGPVEAPVPEPKPVTNPEVPGEPPSEAPEPVSPPVEVPDRPIPQEDPMPREMPVVEPAPNEIPVDPEGGNIPKQAPLTDQAV
jgi:CPA2 family monovalent cation:H+ antiporter-2